MERKTKQMNVYNKQFWAAHSCFNQIKMAVFSGRSTIVDLKPYKLGLFRYLVGAIIFLGMFQVPAWGDSTGLEYYGYTAKYEKKDVDPAGNYKDFGGIAFNPYTRRLLLVDDKKDVIVETSLDGTIQRIIDISSLRKDTDPSAGAKAITWMGGTKYGIVIENRNKIAVVSIDAGTTSINQEDAVLYDMPDSGASNVASLAYKESEDAVYFINSNNEMRCFKARLKADGSMTILDSFDGAAKWGVGKIGDIAFMPLVTTNLLVLTREDPVNGNPPARPAKVMEVVVDDIPGHTKGDVIGHMDLVYKNIPKPGGLTFDDEGKMYIVGKKTSDVKGEKDFTRFDPSKPFVNKAPSVNAGPDQTINIPGLANLKGTVSDDGLPNPPGAVTFAWSKVSGPGNVTFGNASAKETTASFSVAGSYVLKLTVNDSALSASDEVAVTVIPQNQAPSVNAGADKTITLPNSAALSATVSDDGLPNPPGALTFVWSKVSGPGNVSFDNPNSLTARAGFSLPGTYVLRLTATDGILASTDDVSIIVQDNVPVVGFEYYGYTAKYEKKDVDPAGNYKDFGGVAFDPVSRHLFMVEDKKDVIVETSLDGTIIRVIDVSSFKASGKKSAAPKAITWMGGRTFGIVFENRNAMAVLTIGDGVTSINAAEYPLYDFPKAGASSVTGLAYDQKEDIFYFINSKDEMRVFVAKLNSSANTMKILDSFDGASLWNVGSIGDIAFYPRISPHLLVLTREEPVAPEVLPVKNPKVMEVVVKGGVPGHSKGDIIGQLELNYSDIPKASGLTFDNEGKMYIVGSRTSAVKGEKDLTRFDPQTAVGNLPPVADLGRTLTEVHDNGHGKRTVNLNASLSYDPDGMILDYEWFIDGVSVKKDYWPAGMLLEKDLNLGDHSVILKVRDEAWLVSVATMTIRVLSGFGPLGENTVIDDGSPSINLIRGSFGFAELKFKLKQPGSAEIKIYDQTYNEVKSITTEFQPISGWYRQRWDLTNNDGEYIVSGVYFVLIKSNGSATREKVVVMR